MKFTSICSVETSYIEARNRRYRVPASIRYITFRFRMQNSWWNIFWSRKSSRRSSRWNEVWGIRLWRRSILRTSTSLMEGLCSGFWWRFIVRNDEIGTLCWSKLLQINKLEVRVLDSKLLNVSSRVILLTRGILRLQFCIANHIPMDWYWYSFLLFVYTGRCECWHLLHGMFRKRILYSTPKTSSHD